MLCSGIKGSVQRTVQDRVREIHQLVKFRIHRPIRISMGMADIGGPLAHQLPLHSHRGGLVQPSLVMNHHLDLDCHGHDINISECLIQSS